MYIYIYIHTRYTYIYIYIGNAVYLSNHSTGVAASGGADCVGRARSLLVCDVSPGRVLRCDQHHDMYSNTYTLIITIILYYMYIIV